MHPWRKIVGDRVVWITNQIKPHIIASRSVLRKEKKDDVAFVATLDFMEVCSDATTNFNTCETFSLTLMLCVCFWA
jgi:hypothetical protein